MAAAPSAPPPCPSEARTLRGKTLPRSLLRSPRRYTACDRFAKALDHACTTRGVSSATLAASLGLRSDREGDEARSGALPISAGELLALAPLEVALDVTIELAPSLIVEARPSPEQASPMQTEQTRAKPARVWAQREIVAERRTRVLDHLRIAGNFLRGSDIARAMKESSQRIGGDLIALAREGRIESNGKGGLGAAYRVLGVDRAPKTKTEPKTQPKPAPKRGAELIGRQKEIVEYIKTHGPSRSVEMAAHFGVTPGAVSGSIVPLVQKGHLEALKPGLYGVRGHRQTGAKPAPRVPKGSDEEEGEPLKLSLVRPAAPRSSRSHAQARASPRAVGHLPIARAPRRSRRAPLRVRALRRVSRSLLRGPQGLAQQPPARPLPAAVHVVHRGPRARAARDRNVRRRVGARACLRRTKKEKTFVKKQTSAPSVTFSVRGLRQLDDEALGGLIIQRLEEFDRAFPNKVNVGYQEMTPRRQLVDWFMKLPQDTFAAFFEATTWPPNGDEKKATPRKSKVTRSAKTKPTPRAQRSKTPAELADLRKSKKAERPSAYVPTKQEELSDDKGEREQVLSFIRSAQPVTAKQVETNCALSAGQTKGLLKRLREQGAIKVEGKNRGAKYLVADGKPKKGKDEEE